MIELITSLIIAIFAVAAGAYIGYLQHVTSKQKREIDELYQELDQEKIETRNLRIKNKCLDIEKEELTRNLRTLQSRKIFSNVRKDPLTLTTPKNKLDKVLETMEQEDLETESIANQDGPTLEDEARENEDFMRRTLKAKEELGDLLSEDEKRAWERGAAEDNDE